MDKEKAWERFKRKIPRTILSSSFDNYFKQAYLDSLEEPKTGECTCGDPNAQEMRLVCKKCKCIL